MSTMCGELETTREEMVSVSEKAKQEVKRVQDKLDTTEKRLATALKEREDEKVTLSLSLSRYKFFF